jgi:hypothetical protein
VLSIDSRGRERSRGMRSRGLRRSGAPTLLPIADAMHARAVGSGERAADPRRKNRK